MAAIIPLFSCNINYLDNSHGVLAVAHPKQLQVWKMDVVLLWYRCVIKLKQILDNCKVYFMLHAHKQLYVSLAMAFHNWHRTENAIS